MDPSVAATCVKGDWQAQVLEPPLAEHWKLPQGLRAGLLPTLKEAALQGSEESDGQGRWK